MTPYRATILGQEATVSGWLDDRTLLLSDGRRFAFAPPPPAGSRTRRLLAVAVLRATRAGWLIDGRPLEELGLAAVRTGPITGWEFGLLLLRSEIGNLSREDAEATNAVAWFADSSLEDGQEDQGWTNPVILREICELAPTLEPAEAINEATRDATTTTEALSAKGQEAMFLRRPASEIAALGRELAARLEKDRAENHAAHKATHKALATSAKQLERVEGAVETVKDYAVADDAERDRWRQNPLGCGKEAMADFLLAMDAVGIRSPRAVALVRYGYGATQRECANMAGVSVETLKRDLVKARQTPYSLFLKRAKGQRLKDRQAMKKPDEAFALLTRLAEIDPEQLRAVFSSVTAKGTPPVQPETDTENQWDQTLEATP